MSKWTCLRLDVFPTQQKKTCRRNSFQRIKINNSDKLLVTETPWTFRCGQCANFPLGRSHSLPIFVSLNLSGNELSVRKGQGTLHWCAQGPLLGITIPLHLILFILLVFFYHIWRVFFTRMIFWYPHCICSSHTKVIWLPVEEKFRRTQLAVKSLEAHQWIYLRGCRGCCSRQSCLGWFRE